MNSISVIYVTICQFFKNYSSDNGNVLRTGAAADRERSNSEAGLREASNRAAGPSPPQGALLSPSGGPTAHKMPAPRPHRIGNSLPARCGRRAGALGYMGPNRHFRVKTICWAECGIVQLQLNGERFHGRYLAVPRA